MMRYKVLVICDGNICRSPMAAMILSRRMPALDVESAGLGAVIGGRIEPEAAALLRQQGIESGEHIARQINQLVVKNAKLIMAMTDQQKREIESRYQFAKGRVFRIGEHGGFDVEDPYRRGRSAFVTALQKIERGLDEWIPILRRIEN